ncbi:MAG: small, acid-soluble spore protein, alpha/beta type [Clostridia bacterium]|nr:small, acid-soluble spore protein, alpha/beta type [Clostridia bacterium]
MATSNNNRKVVPEAMDALDKFKYEVASDIAVKNIFERNYLLATVYLCYFFVNFFHFV